MKKAYSAVRQKISSCRTRRSIKRLTDARHTGFEGKAEQIGIPCDL